MGRFSSAYGRGIKPIFQPVLNFFSPGPAFAADTEEQAMKQYEQFKVHMTNYSVRSGEFGCYSFSVVTKTAGSGLALSEIDIVLRDLEQLHKWRESAEKGQGSPVELYHPTTWQFPVN